MKADIDAAIERWIEALNPPDSVRPMIRRKFKRLKLTAAEIDSDRFHKISRSLKPVYIQEGTN